MGNQIVKTKSAKCPRCNSIQVNYIDDGEVFIRCIRGLVGVVVKAQCEDCRTTFEENYDLIYKSTDV